jgi:hypothetical protein
VDLRACGTGSKTPGGIPLPGEGEAHRPPQERGFHCFFLHRGEDPQVSQNPGSFERGRETEEGFCHKKPTGESKTRVMRKPKDSEGGIPRILPPSTLWTSVPFLERCISNSPPEILSCGGPIPPSICKPRNLPRVFLEELRKVPPFQCGPFK